MATYVVCPDEEQWEIIGPFLAECQEGAIVLSPDVQKAIEKKYGLDSGHIALETGGTVDYDYGGECDVMLDYALHMNHMGIPPVLEALGIEFAKEDFEG